MTAIVVVMGDTLCGWIAAAMLGARLPRAAYRVVVVPAGTQSDGLGDIAPVTLVPPSFEGLHAELGFDAAALLRETGGALVLGTAFSGWRSDGRDSFLSFGERGAPFEGVSLRQLAARLRAAGRPVRIADYSIAALAAQVGRMPGRTVPHALSLPTQAYTRLLRSAATGAGVDLSARLQALAVGAGNIVELLALADGGTIECPLLVLDCTGEVAIAGWEDWSAFFPDDHCTVGMTHSAGAAFAHVAAAASGWSAEWPVASGTATLGFRSGGLGSAFKAGRADAAWRGNRLALGAAACRLPPLQPVALELLLRSLIRVIDLFPATPDARIEAASFNRAAAEEQACARDLVHAPFVAAARTTCAASPALAGKLALYRSRGRVPLRDGDIADEDEWAMLFDAMGIIPERYDALADGISIEAIEAHMASVRARAIDAVRTMPPLQIAA